MLVIDKPGIKGYADTLGHVCPECRSRDTITLNERQYQCRKCECIWHFVDLTFPGDSDGQETHK